MTEPISNKVERVIEEIKADKISSGRIRPYLEGSPQCVQVVL